MYRGVALTLDNVQMLTGRDEFTPNYTSPVSNLEPACAGRNHEPQPETRRASPGPTEGARAGGRLDQHRNAQERRSLFERAAVEVVFGDGLAEVHRREHAGHVLNEHGLAAPGFGFDHDGGKRAV